MATFVQADIDNLKAAIIALASGQSVQTVSYNGPPARTVTYRQGDLPTMRSLLASMQQDVGATNGNKGYRLAGFKKGV